jgi:transcriptional regulator with XRE-family HTH domain
VALLDGRPAVWLARASGLSKTTLSDALTGSNPSADKALAIAQALGTTVEFLLTGTDGKVSGVREAASDFSRSGDPNDSIRLPIVADLGGGPSEGQPVIGHMSVPRAQLARIPYLRTELWLVPMPDGTMGDLCTQGDLLICQGPDRAMSERGIYIFDFYGTPIIRRVHRAKDGSTLLIADHPKSEPIHVGLEGPDGIGLNFGTYARVAGAIRITPVT